MKQIIKISKDKAEFINNILQLTGKEIYNKHGMKRDETFSKTAKFENGIEIDIKLVICDEDDKPYTEAVAFKNGYQIDFTEPEDEFLGEWYFEIDGEEYIVEVIQEEK